MRVRWPGLLAAFALLTSCAQQQAAGAVPAAAASDQGEAAAGDIARIYERICLAAFPDEARLQNALAASGAIALSPAEVRSMLHEDPGRGWRLPGTPFTVTVESPPYRTCAVRRMTRAGLPTAKPYLAVLNAYAQQRGLVEGPPQRVGRRLPDGADTVLFGTPLLQAGTARPVETSIYAITNYHGQLDPARFPDAAGGVGVEVRLAHQLVPGS
jgi:hypothetical protein